MHLRLAVNLLWLIVFSVQEVSFDDGCMLWNVKENKLIFSCKTNDLLTPLSLYDNRGNQYAICIFVHFGNQSMGCSSQNTSRIVSIDVQRKEVYFTIHDVKSRNVDGKWKCVQGKRTFTSNVSIFKGIVDDTEVYIKGTLYKQNDSKFVSVQCSTCRRLRGNNVEFLVNNFTEVSITYNPVTRQCIYRNKECSPDTCSCLSNGNEFRATFPFDSDDYIIYSCDMQFSEDETSMIFSKTANLRFNGTNFEVMRTITTIIRMPDDGNKELDRNMISTTKRKLDTDIETENITVIPTVQENTPNMNTGPFILALPAIILIVCAVIITLICVFRQRRRAKGDVSKHYQNQFNIDEATNLVVKSGDVSKNYRNQFNIDEATQLVVESELALSKIEIGTSMEKEPVVSTIEASTSMENANLGCDSVETMTEKSYLDTVEKNKKIEDMIKSGGIKRCFLCSVRGKMKSALYWCLDCGNGFCTKCQDMHQALNHHTIVEIQKLPKNYRLSICCPQHKQFGLDYFCIDHDELCCLECRHIDHTSCHRTENIDVVSKACRQSPAFLNYEDQLHVCSGVLTTICVLVTRNIESIEKDFDRVQQLISATKENEAVETEYTRKLNMDLMKTKAMCLSTLKNHISETEIIEASTEELKGLFDFFFENGSNKSLYRFIHSSKHNLNAITAKVQSLSEKIIRLSIHYLDYEEENPVSGRIEVHERKHGVFPDKNQSETSVQIPIATSTVSFESEFVISTEKIQGSIAVSYNGSILVCDTVHQSLLVFVENKQQESIKLSYIPEDVCCIPDSEIAVLTCRIDIIQFVDISTRAIMGTKEVEGSAACSVACTSEYILIGCKKKIVMLGHEGTLIKIIETEFFIRKLSYLKKQMYFTEYGSNKVCCIEMNGDKVFCQNTKNVSAPICAIPNAEGHVYILDRGPIKLHKLSTYGQSIRLEIKDKVDLKNPKSMCFNKEYSKLYVLNNGGSSICTLKIAM